MTAFLPFIFAALIAASFLLWRQGRRSRRRQHAIRELLDAADAVEARLRAAREEIEAIAGEQADPMRSALQEILRQRLWLQQHAADASLGDLRAVRASLDAARIKLDGQLRRVDQARLGGA